MSCNRARSIDLAAYLVEPEAAEWQDFRSHFPGCGDCSAEVAAWTELEAGLRDGPAREESFHPEPALLVAFDGEPRSLPVARRQALERHLAGCRSCADELAALRGTDFEAIRAGAPATTSDALRQLGRSVAGGLRDLLEGLAGRAREAAEWTIPTGEPAVQFQSAPEGAPVGVLVAVAGKLSGKAFPLAEGESRLGRAPECEVRLEGGELARIAARVVAQRERVEIVSADPRLPVRINGRPVERGTLADGDVVELGSERLQFRSVRA